MFKFLQNAYFIIQGIHLLKEKNNCDESKCIFSCSSQCVCLGAFREESSCHYKQDVIDSLLDQQFKIAGTAAGACLCIGNRATSSTIRD